MKKKTKFLMQLCYDVWSLKRCESFKQPSHTFALLISSIVWDIKCKSYFFCLPYSLQIKH